MRKKIKELFERYESETNAALNGNADIPAMTQLYDAAFIESSPMGVTIGKTDAKFRKSLTEGMKRNRQIGAQKMTIRTLRVKPIDALNALASMDWRATYLVDGIQKSIDFPNAYLTRVDKGRVRVFGWITGDGEAELRKHGVI